MMRTIIAFLAMWGIVFMGISFFWHSSATEKIDMMRNALYSLATASATFLILFLIVVLF
jgi:hypothetical protein